jgi:hypothetical protein
MNKLHLIVEGHGDEKALPILIRRIFEVHNINHIQLTQPQLSGDIQKVTKRLGDFLNYGLKNKCPILWVLDCDDKQDGTIGCPVKHVENLRKKIQDLKLHPLQPIEFAFFTKEFESLFLAEKQALIEYYGLAPELKINPASASRRNAKGEISQLLGKSRAYKETIDQAKITARLDLAICRAVSRDYEHFENAILRLCQTT